METFPRYWPFVRGIHRSTVNSPHKGQWRGALMYSLIWVWINGLVNNVEAGVLRRHRVHYDVTVMSLLKIDVRCDILRKAGVLWWYNYNEITLGMFIYTLGKKGCYTPGLCVFFVIISISSVREIQGQVVWCNIMFSMYLMPYFFILLCFVSFDDIWW